MLLSSVAILVLAFVPWGALRRPLDANFDLSAVLAAATMASPVAWEHHYGVFLPISPLSHRSSSNPGRTGG